MNDKKLIRILGIIISTVGIIIILFGNIKTTETFRLLDLIQSILLLIVVTLIFMPNKRILKIALIIGSFTMVFDWVLETIAVYLNWWYPLGGLQYPPIIIVPLEMVVGFLFIGASMGVILNFPEKIREMEFKILNWIKPLVKEPKYDKIWRFLLILLNAIIGTNGDYSAPRTIWAPGPYWHPIYTFFVWFGGGIITILLFQYLILKIKEK